jgi:hypothetical protein
MGSCLDPELPGTSLQKEGGEGPSQPYSSEKSLLEPSRDGENMRTDREEHIPDVMKEDQRPTEWEDYYLWLLDDLKEVTCRTNYVTTVFFLSGE